MGEALLDRARPLRPTPDTGTLRTDLVQLVTEGGALIRTAPVRTLLAVLIEEAAGPSPEVAEARDRFWAAHMEEARRIVDRAVARSELPPTADPEALVDLVIGPALLRALLMGQDLGPSDARMIVGRAIAALQTTRPTPGPASERSPR